MQIISRSVHEGLVIDNDIVVTVLEIQDKFVRLGIETPNQFPFYREEVLRVGDDDGWSDENESADDLELEPMASLAAF